MNQTVGFLHPVEAFDFTAFVFQEMLKHFKSGKTASSEDGESTISK